MSKQNAFVKEVGDALQAMADKDGLRLERNARVDLTGVTTDAAGSVTFELEAPPVPGEIPQRVIDELMHVRTIAKDYATSYSEAAKAQAEKYSVNEKALKRFIAAKCDDKMAEAAEEADALAKLLDS